MTTPVSKTPEKNFIKAVADPQGIAIGVEVQLDSIGISLPVEQFTPANAEKDLPRATFTANGIRREIFVDTASNTVYVRRLREHDATALASTETFHDVVVERIEKSAELVIVIADEKKQTQPTPSPAASDKIAEGAVAAVTPAEDKPPAIVNLAIFGTYHTSGLAFTQEHVDSDSTTDTASVTVAGNATTPLPLRDLLFTGEAASSAELNIRGATQMYPAPIAVPVEELTFANASSTETTSATETALPKSNRLHFHDAQRDTRATFDQPRIVGFTDFAGTEATFRPQPALRGSGLFENVGGLIATFKQVSEPSQFLLTQMVTPLSALIPSVPIAAKPIFNDMHMIDTVAEGESSRDSSDTQQHAQDDQQQEHQDSHSEEFA